MDDFRLRPNSCLNRLLNRSNIYLQTVLEGVCPNHTANLVVSFSLFLRSPVICMTRDTPLLNNYIQPVQGNPYFSYYFHRKTTKTALLKLYGPTLIKSICCIRGVGQVNLRLSSLTAGGLIDQSKVHVWLASQMRVCLV